MLNIGPNNWLGSLCRACSLLLDFNMSVGLKPAGSKLLGSMSTSRVNKSRLFPQLVVCV